MMGSLRILAATALAFIAATGATLANDVFAVSGVKVRTEADSATEAKRAAYAEARREAIDILLRRLTPESEWIYLPDLTSGDPAPAAGPQDPETSPLSDAYLDNLVLSETGVSDAPVRGAKRAIVLTDTDIEQLEAGFNVFNERSSSRTYAATVSVSFAPQAIRDLLRDAGLPYSETQTRNALVLPVLQTSSGLYLWESNNPWFAAWRDRPLQNELTPMLVPLGELEDVASVTAEDALALDERALGDMALRYGVTQVVVAHAQLEQIEGQNRLRVRLVNGYRESAALAEEADPYSPDGFVVEEVYDPIVGGSFDVGPEQDASDVGEVLAEGWYRAPTGDFPALARRAIGDVLAGYAEEWKKATLIDHLTARVLLISAHVQNARQWVDIRRALGSTPFVESVQVIAMSPTGALLSVQVVGEVDKLTVALDERGLTLWSSDDDAMWNIANPAYAPTVRQRLRNSSGSRSRFRSSNDAPGGTEPSKLAFLGSDERR